MAAPVTLPANATRAQALAALAADFGALRYHNTAKTPYEGMNASQLYSYVSNRNPGATPHDIAVAVADLLLSTAVGSAVGASAGAAAGAFGAVETGIANASFVPSWAAGLTGLLANLTTAALWIRVAKIVVGGALLLIGVAHMTGASNAVASAARKVPLPV